MTCLLLKGYLHAKADRHMIGTRYTAICAHTVLMMYKHAHNVYSSPTQAHTLPDAPHNSPLGQGSEGDEVTIML